MEVDVCRFRAAATCRWAGVVVTVVIAVVVEVEVEVEVDVEVMLRGAAALALD